jgi:hypothetical protein
MGSSAYGIELPVFRNDREPTETSLFLKIPILMILPVFAVPTVFAWYRDHRRDLAEHCVGCGYNLTGNVSGVCPECGTPLDRPTSPIT